MAVVFAVIVSLIVLAALLAPFFFGDGGALVSSSSIESPERLEKIKQAIVKRYIADEKALEDGIISKSAWEQRKQFLTNRYIDASRQYDYLVFLKQHDPDGPTAPSPSSEPMAQKESKTV